MQSHSHTVPTRRLIGIQAAAELVGVDEKSIRRYIADGDLPGFRLGKRLLRVREEDRWTSECDEERHAASLECRLCPIVTECLNAARDMKTPTYVWGGHDFGTQARKQKQQ